MDTLDMRVFDVDTSFKVCAPFGFYAGTRIKSSKYGEGKVLGVQNNNLYFLFDACSVPTYFPGVCGRDQFSEIGIKQVNVKRACNSFGGDDLPKLKLEIEKLDFSSTNSHSAKIDVTIYLLSPKQISVESMEYFATLLGIEVLSNIQLQKLREKYFYYEFFFSIAPNCDETLRNLCLHPNFLKTIHQLSSNHPQASLYNKCFDVIRMNLDTYCVQLFYLADSLVFLDTRILDLAMVKILEDIPSRILELSTLSEAQQEKIFRTRYNSNKVVERMRRYVREVKEMEKLEGMIKKELSQEELNEILDRLEDLESSWRHLSANSDESKIKENLREASAKIKRKVKRILKSYE